MSEKRNGDRGCWLSVSVTALAAIAWLLSKIHRGEVAALQTKITDGRSCLPYSRGLATMCKVQENLNNFGWFCLWVCVHVCSFIFEAHFLYLDFINLLMMNL